MNPKKSGQIYATEEKLEQTRSELKSDIAALRLNMESRFDKIESKLEEVSASVHRVYALVEEQNTRNKYVLDGLAFIYDRQEKFENETRQRFSSLEEIISKYHNS